MPAVRLLRLVSTTYADGAAKRCADWQLRSAAPRRLGCQADPVVARPFDLDGSEDRKLILRSPRLPQWKIR